MKLIPSSSRDFREHIRVELGNPLDLVIESSADGQLTIVYLASIINASDLQDNILGPLTELSLDQARRYGNNGGIVATGIKERGRICRQDFEAVISDLLDGRVAIHQSGETSVYTFDTLGAAKRQPTDPNTERTVRGARISFVESFRDSISMIRSLLKDPSLRIEGLRLGTRTQTNVALIYLAEVADPGLVEEVRLRLKRIKIDGLINTGYLEQLITDNRWTIFPLTQATERPDKIIAGLLEGRVALISEGSTHAVIVPTTVNDLYQSPEDYYWGFLFGSFLRAFRILGNNLAVALPGLYIALLGVNPDLLPVDFVLTVSGSRIGVVFPLVFELLIMEIIVEIFREPV
ncbi:MAG: spore germination protein [Firmicutes bacterium]|nr:spore germination protein [Bacillota bacterium]